MTPFEVHLKGRVATLHRQWGKPWSAGEWDKLHSPLRSTLQTLKEIGGDSDFVLFVLASFRWRDPISKSTRDHTDAAKLLVSINRLRRSRGRVWKEMGEDLRKVELKIGRILLDESPSEVGLSGREPLSGRRPASNRTS